MRAEVNYVNLSAKFDSNFFIRNMGILKTLDLIRKVLKFKKDEKNIFK